MDNVRRSRHRSLQAGWLTGRVKGATLFNCALAEDGPR